METKYKMKILEIDDNTDIIKFVEMTAVSLGHEFLSATGGKEGLKMIEENQFDLVFLDLSMPEFSGIDVINELVTKKLMQNQRIILFTASTGIESQIDDLINKGIHSYLVKPVDIDALMDKINEIEKLL